MGGDSHTGQGGTPAQIGVDFGDEQKFEAVPTSDVASSSNVGVAGRYAFRLSRIGCGSMAARSLQPTTFSHLGGTAVRVHGLCVSAQDNVTCGWPQSLSPGKIVGPNEVECIMPTFRGPFSYVLLVFKNRNLDAENYNLNLDPLKERHPYFPLYNAVEEDPTMHATLENEGVWDSDEWSGSASISYNANDLAGASTVNVDFVSLMNRLNSTGKNTYNAELLETRLVTDAPNNGNIGIPSRLFDQTVLFSIHGALRITPSDSTDGRVIWSRLSFSLWYLKLILSEMAAHERQSQQTTLKIHPYLEKYIDASTVLQAIKAFVAQSPAPQANVVRFVLESVAPDVCTTIHSIDQNNPTDFSLLQQTLIPPCTFRQALADVRFRLDTQCNGNSPWNQEFCKFFHPGAANCVILIWPFIVPFSAPPLVLGQQACFNSDGNILPFDQGGGTIDKTHPLAISQHFYDDLVPYLFCCKFSDNCNKYEEMRPSQGCEGYVPGGTGWMWGDPHQITMDGLSYTFNDVGLFDLLVSNAFVDGKKLTVQGRMKPVDGPNGKRASIFTGFAMQISGSQRVQVEAHQGKIRVLINGQEQDAANEYSGFLGGDYTKTADAEVTVVFRDQQQNQAGVAFTVMNKEGALVITPGLSPDYKGKIKGLFGNYDDIAENDIQDRDGNVYSPVPEGLVLHNALSTWKTSPDESIYFLKEGEMFEDDDFEPVFPSIDDLIDQNNADVCEGDAACLFDLYVTEDMSFAMCTKEVTQQVQQPTTRSCGAPMKIDNGKVSYYSGTTRNSQAYYACDMNYELKGNNFSTCNEDGSWSTLPTCNGNIIDSGAKLNISFYLAFFSIVRAWSLFI